MSYGQSVSDVVPNRRITGLLEYQSGGYQRTSVQWEIVSAKERMLYIIQSDTSRNEIDSFDYNRIAIVRRRISFNRAPDQPLDSSRNSNLLVELLVTRRLVYTEILFVLWFRSRSEMKRRTNSWSCDLNGRGEQQGDRSMIETALFFFLWCI